MLDKCVSVQGSDQITIRSDQTGCMLQEPANPFLQAELAFLPTTQGIDFGTGISGQVPSFFFFWGRRRSKAFTSVLKWRREKRKARFKIGISRFARVEIEMGR
jgi:hypothetical protein